MLNNVIQNHFKLNCKRLCLIDCYMDSMYSDVHNAQKYFLKFFGFTKQHKMKQSYQPNNLQSIEENKIVCTLVSHSDTMRFS